LPGAEKGNWKRNSPKDFLKGGISASEICHVEEEDKCRGIEKQR
jgi:hypothetical protein